MSEEAIEAEEEMDYPLILNRALPQDIRVLGWTDVPGDFSARLVNLFPDQRGAGTCNSTPEEQEEPNLNKHSIDRVLPLEYDTVLPGDGQ